MSSGNQFSFLIDADERHNETLSDGRIPQGIKGSPIKPKSSKRDKYIRPKNQSSKSNKPIKNHVVYTSR